MRRGVYNSVTDLIGGTPSVILRRIPSSSAAQIRLKLEHFSATASAKDCVAWAMLRRAEAEGLLHAGSTVIEATCGNEGIALAMLCAAKDLNLIVVLPESVSVERRALLVAYGATVELTPPLLGMGSAISRAKELLAQNPDGCMPSQYDNPDNVAAQLEAGAELVQTIRADGGEISAFVTSIGTGGTLTGMGRALKAAFPSVKVIAVEPVDEPLSTQGLGTGHESTLLDRSLIDRTFRVHGIDAWRMRTRLGREEGILASISTGANLVAAVQIAEELGPMHRVYSICHGSGERDFSLGDLFS